MELTDIIAVRPNKTLYRDGAYAVKLMHAEYSAADVLNEALNLAIVSETGLKVPALREVLKIDGCWAIVTEYIEGRTLADQLRDDPGNADAHLARFVEIQMNIHAHTAGRLRHLTDKMQAKISVSGMDGNTRYELHTRLDGLHQHNKLCHGDFTPGNVILTPSGEAYILDWAHATQGNASADAARTYLRFSLAGEPEYAETYLRLFCQHSGTARPYVQKWLAIVAASQLVKGNPDERALLTRWVGVAEF